MCIRDRFQELVSIYRGTSRADMIYYYYAKSMMGQKDYAMATHYFKSLLKEFPGSQYAEEAQFMVGYCGYLLSPKPRLDQSVTRDAIDVYKRQCYRCRHGMHGSNRCRALSVGKKCMKKVSKA